MRNPYFIFAVFGITGLPFLLLGLIFTYSSIQKSTSWQTTEGVITSIQPGNTTVVGFDYEGKHFETSTTFGDDSMSEGQSIDVYFPPGRPEQAEVRTFMSAWFLSLIFLFFGVSFGSIGFFGVRTVARRAKAKKELFTEQRGKKLANLNAVVGLNSNYSVNKVHPYVIDASWTDPISKTAYTFRSENLWINPSAFIKNGTVDVYVDESNFKRYYVDVTFLQKDT